MACLPILAALAVSVAIIFFPLSRKRTVSVGGMEIGVTEARSVAGKAAGLMGRKDISGENVMLFRFVLPGKKIFWCAGMKFPVDIFWIMKGNIIGVSENIPPGVSLIASPKKVDAVLEISSSLSRQKNVPKYGKITYLQ